MALGWVIMGSLYFSWSSVAVFIGFTATTLCLGHSLGMHRKLIHESFECVPWLEKVMIWCGVLVGLGGPFTMMHMHDMRDWAQRQKNCHPFLSHQSSMTKDFWWQLHCKLHLVYPPNYHLPSKIAKDRFYQFLQQTSLLQQLLPGVVFYVLGGWGWVAWGICGRVTISIFGHWLVGYHAHNIGSRDWHITGAAVQGYNVPAALLFSFGECWHNNHHAFPQSAKMGLYKGQIDPGWVVLKGLMRLGLVYNVKQPKDLPKRPELSRIS
ncbi:MAG: acyl-CoA desaturase [Cohaesibacteraceae bacterium]|nr:acyl-CoA desaturase [Cohaesibacteraceae bacterium]